MRLEYAGQSVTLPDAWSEHGAATALPRIQQIVKRAAAGLSLLKAADTTNTASSQQRLDWGDLLAQFRKQRPAASDETWRRKYLPVLTAAGERISRAADGTDLMLSTLESWEQGSRSRQIARRNLQAFLEWAVARQLLKPCFAPPASLPETLKPKRVGYPLTDAQIIRIVEGVPDERWRFAVQLCAEFGLRPEELRWLRIKDGQLWCLYRKSKGGSRGDKTEPRRLHSLPVAGAEPWNLSSRVAAGEPLPPLGQEGHGGEALATYLRRRAVWQSIKAEAEYQGEQLTAYSFRHRYARESHRAGITVADIAAAMGHTIETHLLSYARFTPDSTAAAYAAIAATDSKVLSGPISVDRTARPIAW